MICQIVDVVKDETNFPCILMEKYDRSLENIIKENPEKLFPESYILRIFTLICIPLYYVHKNNIVHRDLKPANFFRNSLVTKKFSC
jgi:serine/threonine protein kinase